MALEVAPGTTRDPARTASADPTHGLGEPALGRGAHRQRAAAQARAQGLAANGAEIPAQAPTRPTPRRSALGGVSTQPRSRDRRLRFLRRGHCELSPALRLRDDRAWLAPAAAFERHPIAY